MSFEIEIIIIRPIIAYLIYKFTTSVRPSVMEFGSVTEGRPGLAWQKQDYLLFVYLLVITFSKLPSFT